MNPQRFQTKDLLRRINPNSLSGRQTLPPHLFPTIFRVSCSVLTVVTAIGGATPRCPSVACPTLSPVTLTPVYPALGCDTALLRAEKLSLLSVSRCYRWGEDVTRSALGNHQPKFQRKNKELNLVQRFFWGGIGDKCFYLERNLKKINVEMKSFVCPHVRLSCCLSVGFNF